MVAWHRDHVELPSWSPTTRTAKPHNKMIIHSRLASRSSIAKKNKKCRFAIHRKMRYLEGECWSAFALQHIRPAMSISKPIKLIPAIISVRSVTLKTAIAVTAGHGKGPPKRGSPYVAHGRGWLLTIGYGVRVMTNIEAMQSLMLLFSSKWYIGVIINQPWPWATLWRIFAMVNLCNGGPELALQPCIPPV